MTLNTTVPTYCLFDNAHCTIIYEKSYTTYFSIYDWHVHCSGMFVSLEKTFRYILFQIYILDICLNMFKYDLDRS